MKIAVLAGPGAPTHILLNALWDAGHRDLVVILEPAVPRTQMLRARARRLGWWPVLGQVAFVLAALPGLRRAAGPREAQICAEYGLRTDPPEALGLQAGALHRVASANAPEVAQLLQQAAPQVVIVHGTRILKPAILEATGAPYLNTHAGITPLYRGVHGGYWALFAGDAENFGVTVHLVDPGVDTGAILAQVRGAPAPEDSFATYPLLQQAWSLAPLRALLAQVAAGTPLTPQAAPEGKSRQWYHPTLWQYLRGRLRGVK